MSFFGIINYSQFIVLQLYVGDETRDIEAAQKAGVSIAAVTWGYNSAEVLRRFSPDYLVNRPDELLSLMRL